jgi:predicted dithiol-disulfide oxidoreductase (DUF899 family)
LAERVTVNDDVGGSRPSLGAMVFYELEQDDVFSSYYNAVQKEDDNMWSYWMWLRIGMTPKPWKTFRIYCDASFEEPQLLPRNWEIA